MWLHHTLTFVGFTVEYASRLGVLYRCADLTTQLAGAQDVILENTAKAGQQYSPLLSARIL